MDIPENLLDKYRAPATKSGAPRNERQEMMDKFLAKLNPPREAEGYPPLTVSRLSVSLQGIPTGDLHAFYQECSNAKSFGRFFWWSLKPQED